MENMQDQDRAFTLPYLLRGCEDDALEVRFGQYEELLQKLKLMIKHKIPFIILWFCLIIYLRLFEDQGFSSIILAKKLWVISYMSLIQFSNIVGLIIRLIHYNKPEIVFKTTL